MTETTHPAVAARRRRLHQIRVRVATGAVGVLVAVLSVIYAQMPASGRTTSAQPKSIASTSSSAGSAVGTQPTPMTTSQS